MTAEGGPTSRQIAAGNATHDTVCDQCNVSFTFAVHRHEDCMVVTSPTCGNTTVSGSTPRAFKATAIADLTCEPCGNNSFAVATTDNCVAHTVCGMTTKGGKTSGKFCTCNTKSAVNLQIFRHTSAFASANKRNLVRTSRKGFV